MEKADSPGLCKATLVPQCDILHRLSLPKQLCTRPGSLTPAPQTPTLPSSHTHCCCFQRGVAVLYLRCDVRDVLYLVGIP